MFCEVSPALARERGLEHGGWATLRTPRGQISCRVLVTDRMRPLTIDGRTVHQVAVPWHYGRLGLVTGDTTNELLGFVGDPTSHIQESKVATVDIVAGRRRAVRPPAGDDGGRDLPGVGQPHDRPSEVP
jgi:formate dehydrogenase major subunit